MKRKGLLTLIGSICLVLVLAALPFMAACPAPTLESEKPITWKLNTPFMPEGYPGEGLQWFCDEIKTRSSGRLIIEPYFSSSLGYKAPEALSIAKEGLVEVSDVMCIVISGDEPFGTLCELPFLFQGDYEKTWTFSHTVFLPEWKRIVEERWNSIILADYMLGAVDIFSKKPLTSLDDLKGLKVRSGAAGALSEGLEAMGCKPFMVPTAELYTALQRGMVEAAITTPVSAVQSHFWEVLGYDNRFAMSCIFCNVLVNKDAFEALPKDLQKIVLEVGNGFAEDMVTKRREMQTNNGKILRDNGMIEVELSPEFLSQCRELCEPIWEKYARELGPKAAELIEKAKGF